MEKTASSAPALDAGTYDVVRKRLDAIAAQLLSEVTALNERRLATFGNSSTTLLATEHIRTEHNCVPRDITAVGNRLILGYQVHMGLKSAVTVSDVFSEVDYDNNAFQVRPFSLLTGTAFEKDFSDLFQYYKDARILQLRKTDTQVLAMFQTGQKLSDVRILRWALSADKRQITYVDNRGAADYKLAPSHDFAWIRTTRDNHVAGSHPHVNILDTVFVESMHGDVTIKIENNTTSGKGILSDPVKDPHQGMDDAEISYASLDTVIVLKVRPYRENDFRYYIYNRLTHQAVRIDALGQSCQQLPEGHGLIFPGGYYLSNGDYKIFPHDVTNMQFVRMARAPNGEDILYIYYAPASGDYILLRYNMITRSVEQPQMCNGFTFFPDGRMIIFRAQGEPSRLHAMQVWQTPFVSDEHAQQAPQRDTPLGRIGNRDLVRGISDLRHLQRLLANQAPTREAYADLLKNVVRISDSYHWFTQQDAGNINALLGQIKDGVNAAIGEFEKVLQLTAQAGQTAAGLESSVNELLRTLALETKATLDDYVRPLAQVRKLRGALETTRTVRFINAAVLDSLSARLITTGQELSAQAVEYLLRDDALAGYISDITAIENNCPRIDTVSNCTPMRERVDALSASLDLLVETVGSLEMRDANVRTAILERISAVYAQLNRVRALVDARRTTLAKKEGSAGFAAELAILSQAVGNAISLSDSPEKCDEFLGKLMLHMEELESRYAEIDTFVAELTQKREEIYDSFSARKQGLLDERQRRADALGNASERVLAGIIRRAKSFSTMDDLNTYFTTDAMVLKARALIEDLRALGANVKADDAEGRIKAAREDGLRTVRDRSELFDGEAVKLGRHRFSINTQAIDLTMLPRTDSDGKLGMWFHITGTDYFSPVEDADFTSTSPCWEQEYISENATVYRAEYLAWQVLTAAERGEHGLSLAGLSKAALDETQLLKIVQQIIGIYYDHGYERGIHDSDACKLIHAVLHLRSTCGLLRFAPTVRAHALMLWPTLSKHRLAISWQRQARALHDLVRYAGETAAVTTLASDIAAVVHTTAQELGFTAVDATAAEQIARYLVSEFGEEPATHFIQSGIAADALVALHNYVRLAGAWDRVHDDLRHLRDQPRAALRLARAWVDAFLSANQQFSRHEADEIAAWFALGDAVPCETMHARTDITITELLGQHARIVERGMTLSLDDYEARLRQFASHSVPQFRHFQERRRTLLERERKILRVDEFKPRVLTSFVRNRLINEVYLPLIGDNLAKQMGALGANRRTDLMGMLLLISPPGYGKTTLVEYVSSVLGLAFMKINGPALGHDVSSIDPQAAPNAAARQELEKLNLALEMGNNVLIIVDDIQHTSPEFLQKFISLCDGSRRIEGVWRGRARTYDLRGKKVVVVMAGNPYTESGEQFKIPDMLANRADTYNLGDILGGHAEAFALSYIENVLTANPILAQTAGRPQADLYRLIRLAQGDESVRSELEHPYSALEIGDITAVLAHLLGVQKILGQVNATYIASAATADAYRTEPPFKLQGSYRNMAKIAAKIVPLMTASERDQLIRDHYAGESQTLTTGAEANLLKFKTMMGNLATNDAARWKAICSIYTRRQELADGDDPANKAVLQLAKLSDQLNSLRGAVVEASQHDQQFRAIEQANAHERLEKLLDRLSTTLSAIKTDPAATQPKVEIINTLPKYYANLYAQQIKVIEQTLIPAVNAMSALVNQSQNAKEHLGGIATELRNMMDKQNNSDVIEGKE
jgi:ATPase involved in DNA repair/ATPase family associated with various cellular activities (AAA)